MSDRDDMTPPEEPLGPEDRDEILAAEFVLRLLGPEDEAAAAARAVSDAGFAARVGFWRARLAALDGGFAPVSPRAAVWERIERRVFGPASAPDPAPGAGGFWSNAGIWRGLAAGFAAVSLALAVLVVTDVTLPPEPAPARLVSSLDADDGSTAFLVLVDRAGGVLQIARTAPPPPPAGSDYEVWFLDDSGVPESLGLLPDAPLARLDVAPDFLDRLREGVLIEVTEEPAGGSPTGGPTGAVLGIGPAQDL